MMTDLRPRTNEAATVLEITAHTGNGSETARERNLQILENGGILLMTTSGFSTTAREASLMSDPNVTLPTRRQRNSRSGRPTVIYDPDRRRIVHSRVGRPGRGELQAMMSRYSDWTADLVETLFPHYRGHLVRDRLTYRPCRRVDPQGLHVDASYGHPTGGRGMLRVFCNIDPGGEPRLWRIGEPFEPFARRYVHKAGRPRTSRAESLLATVGAIRGRRSAYDHLMADIRGQVKADDVYQKEAPQRIVAFPPGSAWVALTDLVLHGAASGQHSIDQTFFLPVEAMRDPARSSRKILESLTGRSLA